MILTMVEHVLEVNIGQHGQWSKIKERAYNEIEYHLNRIYCLPQTLYLAKKVNIKVIKLLIVQEQEHVNMGNLRVSSRNKMS